MGDDDIKILENLEGIKKFITSHKLCVLYVTADSCAVCRDVKPMLERLVDNYPKIVVGTVEVNQVLQVRGAFMVFTVPTILLFANGKEVLRLSRFIPFEKLVAEFNKWC